jgi:predicted enzyme related to lactoylglutathione lyase
MARSLQPMIVTPDLDRLLRFYTEVDLTAAQRMLLSADVEDVDALLAHVEPLGGQVLGPPNDMPWGQRVAHVKDPDGNTLNLTQSI